MGQAIHCGDALALLEADSGIVNDGIEGAQFIDAGSKRLGFCDAGKVPDECRLRAGNLSDGMGRPGVVSGMQHDLMTVGHEQACRHLTQAVGGSGNEDARHCHCSGECHVGGGLNGV